MYKTIKKKATQKQGGFLTAIVANPDAIKCPYVTENYLCKQRYQNIKKLIKSTFKDVEDNF